MKQLILHRMIAVFMIMTLLAPPLSISSLAAEATGTWRGKWWNYYDRGLGYADKGDWQNALKDFSAAIDMRDKDQRRARTYGMHFTDYFPHRELGIAYFQSGNYVKALEELETSIRSVETDKANKYLDRVRKALIALSSDRKILPPKIILTKPANGVLVKERSIRVVGKAVGEGFVSSITINGNSYPVDKGEKEISFSQEIQLEDGSNIISVVATDLTGNSSESALTVVAKREGPGITLSEVIPEERNGKRFVKVRGDITDSSGISHIIVGSQDVNPKGAKTYHLDISVERLGDTTSYPLRAFDVLDNETVASIDLSQLIQAEKDKDKDAADSALKKQVEQQLELERLAKLQQEAQQLALLKAAAEKAALEKSLAERLAREVAEKARLAKEIAERRRLATERANAERLAREKAENERLAEIQAQEQRRLREESEKLRVANEKLELERLAKMRAEEERLARENAEKARRAIELAEKERLERERAALEKLAQERALREEMARQEAEKARLVREEAERIRAAAEKAEQERLAAEKIAAEKAAKEKAEEELLAKKRGEEEKILREKAEIERLAQERAEQEKIAREKAELEKIQKEQEAAVLVERQKLKEILDEQKLNKALGTDSDKQLELGMITSGAGTKTYKPSQIVPAAPISIAAAKPDKRCGSSAKDKEKPIITLKAVDEIPQVFVDLYPLDGEISDNCLVDKLKINGRPVAINKGKKIYFSKVIRIENGENNIKIEAFDASGNIEEVKLHVTRKLPSVMQNASRMSMVVLPFDFDNSSGSVTPLASDYLTAAMTEQKRFRIAERNKLKSVLEEQKFTQAVLDDTDRTAKLGRIMAAEAIIATNVRETNQSLEVTSRVVNTETSEVMDVLDAYTEDKSAPAVKELMSGLAAKIARVFPVAEGIVISRDDDEVMTDLGSSSHIRQRHGAIFYRRGKEVVHPATGKSLGWDSIKLGEGYIEEVQEGFSKVRLADRYRDGNINPSDMVVTK
ncbi:MAG: CsgG/HfaB family protein [Desulfuromonadaceae bacterium]|nr:CsgG/HfaB family protein [Desulfuromonadaceae bacterium]MDD2855175.1 CsgG/HfaB family protein [Desulfuromonadaceae bacterium]